MPCSFVCPSKPSQNRYTVPSLPVRMVHPLVPLSRDSVDPDEDEVFLCTTLVVHVSPPSVERASTSRTAADPALGPPTKLPKQTYALPKNGLDSALSAHTCSLSANPAALPLAGMSTGAFQALF